MKKKNNKVTVHLTVAQIEAIQVAISEQQSFDLDNKNYNRWHVLQRASMALFHAVRLDKSFTR